MTTTRVQLSKTPITAQSRYYPWWALRTRPNWQPGLALAAVFVYFQFADKVFWAASWLWYYILSNPNAEYLARGIQAWTGFHVYSYRFWARISHGVLLILLLYIALRLYAHNRQEYRLLMGLLLGGISASFFCNILGKLAHSPWLETFGRDSLEFVLSPLTVVFAVPLLMLYRRTQPSQLART